ncbi:hypothetical protein PLICRDRAFT_173585 [Plicaturopsis crispa FD-325 SS-3]|nr:hypothetical protein PLICRDRAFT_173585 [Plicaturopsis crispa FD-325 SS-3]
MAHNATRERKRARTSSPDAKDMFRNHPTLYFEDGNVILKCSNTLFCVHRTLLAKHSRVFARKFAAAESRQSFRGCLFLELQDGKDEMASLINTIYDGFYINLALTVETFPALAGLLRMSTKYQVLRPRDAILDRLRAEWPASLPAHDARKTAASAARLANTSGALIFHPADVLALLRDCGYTSPDLLAPLFYDLSAGTWQFGRPATGYHLTPLSPADIERFIGGVNALRAEQIAIATPPVDVIHAQHKQRGDAAGCLLGATHHWGYTLSPWFRSRANAMCTPIEDYGAIVQALRAVAEQRVCPACHTNIIAHVANARQRLWDMISELFHLV